MEYYIIHKNPKHPEIIQGNEWALDGPFERKFLAEEHAKRCGYSANGIEWKPVNEKELMDILGIDIDEELLEEE